MNKRILLVFGFIFILLGCDQGIEKEVKKEIGYGVIKDGQYQNSYFGMTVKVPEGWSVQSQAQLDEISETGADIIAGDDENLKGALKVSQK